MQSQAARRAFMAATIWLVAGGAASAASFQLREGDPDWLANAFAGSAAKAYDAGTAWNNPAGMVFLNDNEIDSALNYFDPGIRFSGENLVNGKPVRGDTGGDAGPQEFSAGTETVLHATPDLAFGAATEAPFGLRTSYPSNFVGRYQALVSSLFDLQLALSAAYRVTPQFSIGGGPVLTYFHARLTQAINTQAFVPGAGDAVVDIHGDDIAAGYHLGAMYQITDGLRVGIDYHSRIGTDVTGQQRVAIPPAIMARSPFVTAVLQALNQDASAQIALPDYATLSFYDDLSPEWSVMGTVQWTDWSLIKTLSVETPTSVEATPIGFRNTWMGSIGVNWRPPMFPRLTLQSGVLYDEGANTDLTRGPRLPDEDRVGLGVGFQFAVTPKIGFRFGYLHEFPGFGSDKIDYTNNFPGAGTLIGSYANDADVASAGVTMKF
ncbi:MAG TPA: outer membrane protein transport protein [Acetobacteraceae bacterium]|nr:outer membrane protein transport protein [Acetobacteraceae bacterium]